MTDQGRAVGYERLSQDGKSLEEQQDQIEAFCRDQGLELVEHYNDGVYASGYSADREEYQRMLDRIQERDDVGHVVVRDRSRLSRDAKERLRLFLELDTLGVDVHVAETEETIDLDEAYALTRESAQADADDREKRKEAERGRQEAERREECGLPNGPAPLGLAYGPDKERLIPGDQYGDVLEVLDLRSARDMSWREIASETGINKDTARRTWDRRGMILDAGARRRDDLAVEDRELLEALEVRLEKQSA